MRIIKGYVMDRMDSLVEAIQHVEKVRQTLLDNLIHEHIDFVHHCEDRKGGVCGLLETSPNQTCGVTNCPHLQV